MMKSRALSTEIWCRAFLPRPARNERGEGRGEGHLRRDSHHRSGAPPPPPPPPPLLAEGGGGGGGAPSPQRQSSPKRRLLSPALSSIRWRRGSGCGSAALGLSVSIRG